MGDKVQQDAADTTVDDELDAIDRAAQPEPDDTFDYDEDALASLTDEERAAFLEDAEDEADEAEDEADEADEAGEQPDPEEEARRAEADRLRGEQAATEQSLRAKIDALTQERASLIDLYDDGELTRDELNAKYAELDKQIGEVERGVYAIEAERTAEQSAEDRAWSASCRSFLEANPDFAKPEHLEAFDREVYAATSQYPDLTHQQQLEIAAKRLQATPDGASLQLGAGQGAEKAAAPAPKPKAQERKPDRLATEPPRTLGDVPSETIDPNESNVATIAARLDRAGPEEAERIMRSLPEHLRDQVLQYG